MLTAIEDGLLNASAKVRLDDLEAKKADLEISVAREKMEKTPLSRGQIIFWISKFKNGDIDDPKYHIAIADIFVNAVFLFDDKLTITYNWNDGTKTVTLSELEETLESTVFTGSFLDQDTPTTKSSEAIFIKCENLDYRLLPRV
ncbi:MAG: hypothetical protein FWC16_05035 [Defluviitaleaceae bacterium]|nr:hypothetical protein [Defluviitaleaceae bacterium]MCL2274272.1 hypothetical protein [Defluviitaleaceae bacterium]